MAMAYMRRGVCRDLPRVMVFRAPKLLAACPASCFRAAGKRLAVFKLYLRVCDATPIAPLPDLTRKSRENLTIKRIRQEFRESGWLAQKILEEDINAAATIRPCVIISSRQA